MPVKLTPKQQLFVDTYLTNGFNALQACRTAGYKGNDKTLSVVGAENLAKPCIQQALAYRTQSVAKRAEKKIVDVYEEFTQNLVFTKKMRDAAEEWLADPNDENKFTLAPRSTEIDIVYYVMGENGPKPVTESLQALLARLEQNGYDSPTPFVKTVDLRDHALKILDRVDTALDKFAKMGGAYQQDKKNESDVEAVAARAVARMREKGYTEDQIADAVREYWPEAQVLNTIG